MASKDILLVPLFDGAGKPLGLIRVDNPRNGLRRDKQTIESIEVFASQAALTIESHQQVRQAQEQVAILAGDLKADRLALHPEQTHLPLLLDKDMEQTAATLTSGELAQRLQAGLDIVTAISQHTSRQAVLESLVSELMAHLGINQVLVAEKSAGGMRLLHVLGDIRLIWSGLKPCSVRKIPSVLALQAVKSFWWLMWKQMLNGMVPLCSKLWEPEHSFACQSLSITRSIVCC